MATLANLAMIATLDTFALFAILDTFAILATLATLDLRWTFCDKNRVFSKVLETCGQEEVTYLKTTQNFVLLVPGQDMDSGSSKILDYFGQVLKL